MQKNKQKSPKPTNQTNKTNDDGKKLDACTQVLHVKDKPCERKSMVFKCRRQ